MKRITYSLATALFTVFFALALCTPRVQAQDTPTMYAATDYMKSHNVQDYMEIEQTWKKLHQNLVDEGLMFWWGLYEVTAPFGSDHPYDYVTVRIYTDFSQLENPFPDFKVGVLCRLHSLHRLSSGLLAGLIVQNRKRQAFGRIGSSGSG